MAMASHAPLSSCLGAASITPNERPQNVRELSAALHGRTAASIKKAPPLPLAMAESRVVLLGFLSYYGLVPSPEEVCSVPDCDARTERARWRSVLPDDVDVEGAYITAVRTWGVFVALYVRSGAYRKPVGHHGCSLAAVTTRAPATVHAPATCVSPVSRAQPCASPLHPRLAQGILHELLPSVASLR